MAKKQAKKISKKYTAVEENIKSSKQEVDDEPSWYHYIGILAFLGLVFAGFYFGFEYFNSSSNILENKTLNDSSKSYIHQYAVNGNTYNLEFQYTFDELNSFNYPIEVEKLDILNSKNISFAFTQNNGTDNKPVSIASVKLMRFLKYVYDVDFTTDNFQMVDQSNCSTSTPDEKVVLFNPYAKKTGVFYNNSNGCIEVLSTKPEDMVKVGDKLLYKLIETEVE